MKTEKNPAVIKSLSEQRVAENEILLNAIEENRVLFEVLDERVRALYRELKKEIKCEECGECCKSIIVVFEDGDLERLADGIGEERASLEKRLFKKYEKFGCYVMTESPCPFQKNNLCTVYEHRGTECREFPYFETRNFSEIYRYVFQGYSVCPFHYNVVEMLRQMKEFKANKEG